MNTPSQPAPSMIPPAPALPAAEPPQATVPLAVYVAKYRKLRDKIDEIKTRHGDELRPFTDAIKSLDGYFLQFLQTTGQESAKTSDGTVFTSTTTSYSIDDPTTFRAWTEANDGSTFFENRVAKSVLEDYIKRGGVLPPGVKVSSMVRVSVRAPAA